DHQLLRYLLDK
nr:Chain B, Nuclear receptor coactivator 1 [Homo sapiens]3P89_B Chain B, Nuclear receptor coactivator 1 [Homo sapiens]3RUT_B Chain B, Nuclear receptor coactivator 1 [Homo sapiens]3RUU_B Chain B, Nuclear receptor coactivator 1 [Homo sapiens]6A5X_B Chain B, Nuclear receptor coactivator 1 [Homo sapiens]